MTIPEPQAPEAPATSRVGRSARDSRPTPRSALGELKFGPVGIAQLTLRTTDADALRVELAAKVNAAPQMLAQAPLVLDLSALGDLPEPASLRELLAAVDAAGMLAVGLSGASPEVEGLARALHLPLFARFRAAAASADENAQTSTPTPDAAATPPSPPPVVAAGAAHNAVGQLHAEPVRSGQQIYARGRDLTLTAMVGNGAEVIADGSIHIYGVLRGRAIAGAQGDVAARIFCQNFQAQLISIAGQYRVFEEMPKELHGKAVQAWLEGDKLHVAAMR